MRSYSQLAKVGPRCVAAQRLWGPLPLSTRNSGSPICSELPSTSTADRRHSSRHMSVNTRGASPRSGKKAAAKEGEEDWYERAREYIHGASKSSSANSSSENVSASANQAQRETYEEKQSDTDEDFQKVKESPPASNQQWWYPDPFTGHFAPQTNFGEISTNLVLKETKQPPIEKRLDVEKVSKKAPAPSQPVTKLKGVPSKGEKDLR